MVLFIFFFIVAYQVGKASILQWEDHLSPPHVLMPLYFVRAPSMWHVTILSRTRGVGSPGTDTSQNFSL